MIQLNLFDSGKIPLYAFIAIILKANSFYPALLHAAFNILC